MQTSECVRVEAPTVELFGNTFPNKKMCSFPGKEDERIMSMYYSSAYVIYATKKRAWQVDAYTGKERARLLK